MSSFSPKPFRAPWFLEVYTWWEGGLRGVPERSSAARETPRLRACTLPVLAFKMRSSVVLVLGIATVLPGPLPTLKRGEADLVQLELGSPPDLLLQLVVRLRRGLRASATTSTRSTMMRSVIEANFRGRVPTECNKNGSGHEFVSNSNSRIWKVFSNRFSAQ